MKARLDKRPSIERIREVLAYEPDTGILRWRISSGRAFAGREAGCFDKETGYIRVRIDGFFILAHHIAWAIVTGEWPERLDHVRGKEVGNGWDNLRLSTQSQNIANIGKPSTNTSGFKGVSFHKATQMWCAQIGIRGKRTWLGARPTKEEAAQLYADAAREHFGEFARTDDFDKGPARKRPPLRGKHRPTPEEVRAALAYDLLTGILTWKAALSFRTPIGAVAGRLNDDGYVRIGLYGKQYQAHILAWVIMKGVWPTLIIHHDDTVRNNNHWNNLSEITQAENVQLANARIASGAPSLYRRAKMA